MQFSVFIRKSNSRRHGSIGRVELLATQRILDEITSGTQIQLNQTPQRKTIASYAVSWRVRTCPLRSKSSEIMHSDIGSSASGQVDEFQQTESKRNAVFVALQHILWIKTEVQRSYMIVRSLIESLLSIIVQRGLS